MYGLNAGLKRSWWMPAGSGGGPERISVAAWLAQEAGSASTPHTQPNGPSLVKNACITPMRSPRDRP